MPQLGPRHASILKEYPRPVVHLRKQVCHNRFGFIFGSGLSSPFGIPTWEKLNNALAQNHRIAGVRLLNFAPPRAGEPYRTEMLFEHYRKRRYRKAPPEQHHTRKLDYRIASEWHELVRQHLYTRTPQDFKRALKKHPYLKACLPLIRKAHMTVTYNFDDFIEQALLLTNPRDERDKSLGYECVTNPWVQYRRRNAIIYHPNGVIPQKRMETPSDRFVFSESSFAEQMMGIFAGRQAGLLNHLSKNTCLLIGLSLEDEMLRSLLAQSAQSNPGNFHYYVYYIKKITDIDGDKREAIRKANFKVYNLITLFLDSNGICSLIELINTNTCPSNDFCDFAEEKGICVCFRYYLTGPMGAGKSSVLNNFRNLEALDEWLEQRPPILGKPWVTLNDEEKRVADKWIASQFRKKNDILKDDKEGVFMLDRGPLDPLSFTDDKKWKNKSRSLLNAICPGNATWTVQDGRVVILRSDPDEFALRILTTVHDGYTADQLKDNEEKLAAAYGNNGVIEIDTRGLTLSDITRRIAEIVHLEDYDSVCDLHKRLQEIRQRGIDATH